MGWLMRFLITAGPTREPLDPVRYLSNRSSGKMGYALAAAASDAGHEVVLVAGPTALPDPRGASVVPVVTAAEMHAAVMAALPEVEVAIFAAAVADYRPQHAAGQKLKKSSETLTLVLERTPDILGGVRATGFRGVLVGFAAETENLMANATAKLTRKRCDLIVANDVSGVETGFDVDENEVVLVFATGEIRTLPRASKTALAKILVGVVEELMVRSGT